MTEGKKGKGKDGIDEGRARERDTMPRRSGAFYGYRTYVPDPLIHHSLAQPHYKVLAMSTGAVGSPDCRE